MCGCAAAEKQDVWSSRPGDAATVTVGTRNAYSRAKGVSLGWASNGDAVGQR